MKNSEKDNPWKILNVACKYDNDWIAIQHHDVIDPSGNEGIYGVVHFKNTAVAIVPIDSEGNTYLVGQYRFPLGYYSWEVPEGGCLLGNDPLEAAKRELREECGILAEEWKEISRVDLSNSVSDEKGIVYCATGLSFTDASPESTELLQTRKVPLEKAVEMVLVNEIRDSMSKIALLSLSHRGKTLKKSLF